MKKLKFIFSKKGVISLFGVLVALISVIMLCGYLDLTQTTHVVEEIQSIMDITALSTLQGSIDAEGVRFDRMTLRGYEHFIPNPATGKSPADQQKVNSETDKDTLLTMLKADGELAETTIWLDGTNANNVNQITVRNILLKNYNYYLEKLLYTGSGEHTDPLLDYTSSNVGNTNEYNKNSIIKKYEIREFNAELIYSSWGVDAESKEGYQKIPQAYIDTTIILYLSVEPTFSSMNVSVEESHVYNALTSSSSSSKLHVEGYTDDGLLVVSIRTLARMTVQGFISSGDTPDISDITVSYDSIPYTPEEYFDITADGTVTGFSEAYYALPESERPKAIKMPTTIKGVTPVKIGEEAFAGSEDQIVMMVLPASVKNIGTRAFADASYLKDFGFIGTSQLTTMGEGAFSGCTALLHFVSPKGLTTIPAGAFENCTNMTSFSFSSALTTIGDNAFKNCTRLNGALTLPSNVTTIGSYAFFDCKSITSLRVPKQLVNLGTGAFAKMTKLSTITVEDGTKFVALDNVLYQMLADGTWQLVVYPAEKTYTTYTIPLLKSQLVTQIADYAFYGNKYLQEIYYTSNIDDEEKDMMHGIQKVGNNAFEKCSALKTLQFAGDLTDDAGNVVRKGLNSIGSDAFSATSSLSLVYIDKLKNTVSGSPWGANTDITTIRWKADDGFNWSKVYKYTADGVITGLTAYGAKLVLEEGLDLIIPEVIDDPYWGEVIITGIGNNAFSCRDEDAEYADANKKITKLEIVAQLTSIGKNAFRGTTLTTFVLPDQVATVGSYAFAESAITNFEIKGTGNLVFGDGVFMSSALMDFKLSSNVTSIGSEMFKDCANLASFTFEAKLEQIPDYTFSGCKKLPNVVIPATVKTVGAYAFENCSILNSIGDLQKIEHVKEYAFTGCDTIAQFWFTENIKTIEKMAFFKTAKLEQINLEVEEDSVKGAPWGAESYTNIVWLNSKWVKYYTYERVGTNMWRITGLSDIGIEALSTKSLTDFQTPNHNLRENVVSITFRSSDYAYLKNLTSMKINVSYKGGYELYAGVFENCTSLKTITFTKGISKIGENAFKGCTALTQIAIPSDVTSLGQSAFEGCTSMTLASLGTGITVLQPYLFKDCRSLNQLLFMGEITTIGTKAFENCVALPTFHIMKSTSSIGDYAFLNCTSLTSVTSDDAPLAQINTGVFKDCTKLKQIDLPGKVVTIKNNAFENCVKLSTIGKYESSSLQTIETKAFYGCSDLATLQSFPNLTTIANSAFENSGVVTINNQPKLSSIGETAFKNCAKLNIIKAQSSVVTIGKQAFIGCNALTTIETMSNLKTLGEQAFYGCTGLVTVNDMNALTSLGTQAFAGCTSLKTVHNMNALQTVSKQAFSGCTSLQTVKGLNAMVTIGEQAFKGCTSLTTFPVSNTLKTVQSQAFNTCVSLTSITFGTGISSIANDALSSCNNLTTIYIKRSEYNDYQTNTSRSKNVSGTDPWGATNATVYWENTLLIGSDATEYKNAAAASGSVVCVNEKVPLNAKTAKASRNIYYKYNGDINDLTFTSNLTGLGTSYLAIVTKGDTSYKFDFSKSNTSAIVYSLSDIYGNNGQIKWDVDDTIEISSYKVELEARCDMNGSDADIGKTYLSVYYSGNADNLSLRWDEGGVPYAIISLASVGQSVGQPGASNLDSSADKALFISGWPDGCSGRSVVTVKDNNGVESKPVTIGFTHDFGLWGGKERTFTYGLGDIQFSYTGGIGYLRATTTGNLGAASRAEDDDDMYDINYLWDLAVKSKGTITISDYEESNSTTYRAALTTVTVDWQDYWYQTDSFKSLSTSAYKSSLSANLFAGISNAAGTLTYYQGPISGTGYFGATVYSGSVNNGTMIIGIWATFNGATVSVTRDENEINTARKLAITLERVKVTYDGTVRDRLSAPYEVFVNFN